MAYRHTAAALVTNNIPADKELTENLTSSAPTMVSSNVEVALAKLLWASQCGCIWSWWTRKLIFWNSERSIIQFLGLFDTNHMIWSSDHAASHVLLVQANHSCQLQSHTVLSRTFPGMLKVDLYRKSTIFDAFKTHDSMDTWSYSYLNLRL